MKLCMIGTRGHAYYVFGSIHEIPDMEVSGVCSGSSDDVAQLKEMAEKAGFRPAVFDDWQKMLLEVQPDVVCVDGPFTEHAAMAIFALEHNINVFCEKPPALTMEDLHRLEKAYSAGRAHLRLMVGLRYEAPFQQALTMVQQGEIGEVRLINTQKSYKLGERPDYYRERKTYGGTIPWVGSHALDWILAFSGANFVSVTAAHSTAANRGHGDLEATCLCQFVMDSGVLASATIDFLRPGGAPTHGDDRVRVVGTEGVIEVRDGKIFLTDIDGLQEIAVAEPARRLFSDFMEELRSGRPALFSDRDSFALARACLLAREAADSGKVVKF